MTCQAANERRRLNIQRTSKNKKKIEGKTISIHIRTFSFSQFKHTKEEVFSGFKFDLGAFDSTTLNQYFFRDIEFATDRKIRDANYFEYLV